jgi:malate dehydrogenase (oxaloacetate-decarboxylating)(NADP+)
VREFAAFSILILPKGTFFFADTEVSPEPDASKIAETAILAAAEIRRFAIEPKIALLSHSNFGTADTDSTHRMREALGKIREVEPELEVDGEMHGDAAISEEVRKRICPNSRLSGTANLLIAPTLDAANVALNLVKALGDGLSIGPILLGTAQPAHVLTPSITVRGIVNMTAVAVVDAQDHQGVERQPRWQGGGTAAGTQQSKRRARPPSDGDLDIDRILQVRDRPSVP